MARADAEAELDRLEVVDLTAWLPQQQAGWVEHPRAADLRLANLPNGSLYVKAQPLLLGQLLENLVDNAFKYSRPGTPVTVRLKVAGDAVTLAVED